MTVIETHTLAKSYGRIQAVRGIDLKIERGEIFGLLGPNGAGKTTTIGMLCTIIRPSSGSASIAGYDIIKEPSQVRRNVGIVFQELTLDTILTGIENLQLHARLYGIPSGIREKRIKEMIDLVGLRDRAGDLTRTYSGGMRRRLEMARGLLHRPSVLFLDEPTLGLDPQTRARIWDYIRNMAREEHITVVLTTHYMEEAEQVCDRVGIIDNGSIIALETPQKLIESMGGHMVLLKVEAPPMDSIHLLPYVLGVTMNHDILEIIMKDVHLHLPDLLSKVPNVECVETRVPTLNDVFIKLTGRDIREEPAEDTGSWIESVARYRQRGR